MGPRVIRESRAKLAGSLALVLGLLGLSIWLVTTQSGVRGLLAGWLGLPFWGAGVLVLAWRFVRPHVLRLDAAGLVLEGGLRRTPMHLAWADVDRFRVDRGPRGSTMIRFNYRAGRTPPGGLARIAGAFGVEGGGLPKGWTLSPEELVALLNEYCAKPAANPSVAPAQPQIVS